MISKETQRTFTCSKSIIGTIGKGVKYVQIKTPERHLSNKNQS